MVLFARRCAGGVCGRYGAAAMCGLNRWLCDWPVIFWLIFERITALYSCMLYGCSH